MKSSVGRENIGLGQNRGFGGLGLFSELSLLHNVIFDRFVVAEWLYFPFDEIAKAK